MEKSWYAFIGGEDNTNVSNYFNMRGSSIGKCLCGNEICAIYAEDNGIHPKEPLSPNIQYYIKIGLVTQQLQPEFPYESKKYVYLRSKN